MRAATRPRGFGGRVWGALFLWASIFPAEPAGADQSLPPREPPSLTAPGGTSDGAEAAPTPAPDAADAAEPSATPTEGWGPIVVLGEEVAPGEKRELHLLASESFVGASVQTAVIVIRGRVPGASLCLTAGIHGDELNGVEVVRRVLAEIDPGDLRGTVLGVPIVNVHGFQRSSRYLPDRRDLNRFFPGMPLGSSASRIAHALFENVVRNCDALVDLHTGSLHRANVPQIRGDLLEKEVLDLALSFGATVVVHNQGRSGTLRRAASEAGIAAILYEAGEPMRFQKQEIERGIAGVGNVLSHLGMLGSEPVLPEEQHVYWETHWVRVDVGGILVTGVELDQTVEEGDVLGMITDPIRKGRSVVVSPYHGRVIGMTLAPLMIPGYAAFHVGVENGGPNVAGLDRDSEPSTDTESSLELEDVDEEDAEDAERPE